MKLAEFKEKLDEYSTNNITALMGAIQITQNERDDLMRMYQQLSAEDQPVAAKMLKAKGVDINAY